MNNKGEILASVLKSFKGCCFFLHNTREFSAVESIMNDGFIFENQLSHSTDRINPYQPVEITYFFFQRKDYGNYTMIIAIPEAIYDEYAKFAVRNDTVIEEVLTITKPYYGDNDELVYTVSPKHVLGYFNMEASEFHRNINWDPLYNSSFHSHFPRNHIKYEKR